jgi:hypothetical protein
VVAALSLFTSLGFYLYGDGDRAPGTVGTSNNPIVVSGPELESPLGQLNESFEGTTFPPAGWVKITPTGGAGWNRQTNGVTPVPGFNGGTLFAPAGGGNAMAFCNYETGGTTSCDQWLVTPQIQNVQPGDSLTFWMRKFGNYVENFDIKISTTTPTVAAMTVNVATLPFAAADSGWVQYKYEIGSRVAAGSNIYIGFREYVSNSTIDGASFSMDLVRVTGLATGVSQISSEVPERYSLSQNYPNPFNPTTTINFALPKQGLVTLKVYNSLGKEVATLVDGFKNAGVYQANFNAVNLNSGVYFYSIQSEGFSEVKKMMLIK